MDRPPRHLYVVIAGLIAASLALAVVAASTASGEMRLIFLALAFLATVIVLALMARLRASTARVVARLRGVAYEDPLTGLPNRACAEDHIDALLRAPGAEPFALVILELRNVREINAALGHPVGDEALREVARRLRQNTAPADMVARLAASQFLIILHGCSSERAALLARQLVGVIHAGLHLPDVSLDIQIQAGFSQHPDNGAASRELMRRAQIALEDALGARQPVSAYRTGRDEEQRRRLQLAAGLRTAIEGDELRLVFQPELNLTSGAITQLEALVRWRHPLLGDLSPSEFVPIAEHTGSARLLTSWALARAIRQMAQWRAAGLDINVAVNLSAPDIMDPQLVEEIQACLQEHAVQPSRLVLEITESAVMRDPALAARHMHLLKLAGIRFAIDDFGTGHSSLAQLSRLPLDQLKIDRVFITHAHERPADATIVKSTIELAHNMGLSVVAEGIENDRSLRLLRVMGCDLLQGEHISKPLEPAAVQDFVARSARAPA
ncbi:MAG TPA: bifunctional diguanylate cyclase/phosphodiesterase [Steroidobacteraceae bacterium]|jgi:diguanylate cyclase (GGDEF)-like protein